MVRDLLRRRVRPRRLPENPVGMQISDRVRRAVEGDVEHSRIVNTLIMELEKKRVNKEGQRLTIEEAVDLYVVYLSQIPPTVNLEYLRSAFTKNILIGEEGAMLSTGKIRREDGLPQYTATVSGREGGDSLAQGLLRGGQPLDIEWAALQRGYSQIIKKQGELSRGDRLLGSLLGRVLSINVNIIAGEHSLVTRDVLEWASEAYIYYVNLLARLIYKNLRLSGYGNGIPIDALEVIDDILRILEESKQPGERFSNNLLFIKTKGTPAVRNPLEQDAREKYGISSRPRQIERRRDVLDGMHLGVYVLPMNLRLSVSRIEADIPDVFTDYHLPQEAVDLIYRNSTLIRSLR